ncbi:MAG: single-stranded-DNA-specific exonuclease RecJ, partial [Oscillospiraceae bacterium]|nr:single-stranded-DNA-specific exonuclease RecJ [Oscillospiraceae bacterium]
MGYRVWKTKQTDERAAAKLAGQLGIPALLARLLTARGITGAEEALELLNSQAPISDPFLLKDMDIAVERILLAIDREEPIVVFGDYDVDGVTATALLVTHLKSMGANVKCMLPSREGEGYGLSEKIVRSLAEKGFKLIVTVDNGISALNEAELIRELGMELIVTDHHLPAKELPRAVAVVDPMRADDTSPCKDLCGAGVAFKLCVALDGCEPEDLLDFCGDLAAIGTIADVMNLTGENRTLVRHGLNSLQNPDRPGLMALLECCGLEGKKLTAENVSFMLAPRINAAGRMGKATTALSLMICEDYERAQELAQNLCDSNQARQEEESKILAQVETQLEADSQRKNDRILLVWGEEYHPGVIGIVASRLVEKYGRPVMVIALQDGEGRGSGRSISGFNLHDAIASCEDILVRYGGHALAAGLTVKEEYLPELRRRLNEWARENCPILPAPPLEMDMEVSLGELTLEAVQSLAYLEPYGHGNPSPLFLLKNVRIDAVYPVGDKHSRLRLAQKDGALYAAYFGSTPEQLVYKTGDLVDVAVSVTVFESRGGPMISGRIKAIRPAGLTNEAAHQAALFEAFQGNAA